jgi:uncharacterized protein YndB with AHSA1/START domain
MSAPMKIRAGVGVPIEKVRRALVDPEALRTWLAEHAEVDLPHRYAFWGRFTPEGDEPRQRLLYVDDRTLRFSWLIGGEDTTVEIGLEADGEEYTILSLTQTHVPDWEEVVAESGARAVLATFWGLAIANLVDYLTGRDLTPMCDFSSPRMHGQVTIAASLRAVFDSLVEPEQFRRWFGANLEIEPHVGGRWAMGGFDAPGTPAMIVDLEPDRRIVLDWGGFVSTWELEGSEGRTRLTFVHSGFDERRPPYAGWLGWLSGVAELRRFHELSDWRPILLHYDMPGTPDGVLAAG